jgi:hypothetical protein
MIKKYCEYGKKERMNLTQLLYEKEYGIGEKYSKLYRQKIKRLAEMYTPEEAGPLRKSNHGNKSKAGPLRKSNNLVLLI